MIKGCLPGGCRMSMESVYFAIRQVLLDQRV